MSLYTSLEVCAGAGGQAIGLEAAGFQHLACVEIDPHACETLRQNRPGWQVVERNVRGWAPPKELRGVTLLSGGVPCPPFSRAGKQLGPDDDRDLFPEMISLTAAVKPQVVMIENVRGLLAKKFEIYRQALLDEFRRLGYRPCGKGVDGWHLVNASDFGLPQDRRRAILVLMKPAAAKHFVWPEDEVVRPTVGEMLEGLMSERGWEHAGDWAKKAQGVGPALVGGSKKHGGADLGPTSAKAAWRRLGVDGMGVADDAPPPGFVGDPRLTVRMAATLQGFPSAWSFYGGKTAAYRQVGNAFPPPVARAVGLSIAAALGKSSTIATARTKVRQERSPKGSGARMVG